MGRCFGGGVRKQGGGGWGRGGEGGAFQGLSRPLYGTAEARRPPFLLLVNERGAELPVRSRTYVHAGKHSTARDGSDGKGNVCVCADALVLPCGRHSLWATQAGRKANLVRVVPGRLEDLLRLDGPRHDAELQLLWRRRLLLLLLLTPPRRLPPPLVVLLRGSSRPSVLRPPSAPARDCSVGSHSSSPALKSPFQNRWEPVDFQTSVRRDSEVSIGLIELLDTTDDADGLKGQTPLPARQALSTIPSLR